MEGFEKFDMEKPEDVEYLLPPWFLKKVNRVEDLRNLDEFDVMVRVVGAEAANQGPEGQKTVAHVIMNRLEKPERFGGYDIKSVILKEGGFEPITIASTPDEEIEEIPAPAEKEKYSSIKC